MAAPTVADLASYLGISGDYSAYTAELSTVLTRAVVEVERWAGPHGVITWTRRVHTSGGEVYPAVPALLTCTSATTQDGATVTVSDVDPLAGVVMTARGAAGVWTLTGTHGWGDGDEPGALTEACLALARHWWSPRAGLRQAQRTDGGGTAVLGGFAMPRAVAQLVRLVPGALLGGPA